MNHLISNQLIYVSIVCTDGSFREFFYQLIAIDKQ